MTTLRCPHCGAELHPETDGRLFCWHCADYWKRAGNGRLKRAQSSPTLGQLERTRARLCGED